MDKLTKSQLLTLSLLALSPALVWTFFGLARFGYLELLPEDLNIILLVATLYTFAIVGVVFFMKSKFKENNYIVAYGIKQNAVFLRTMIDFSNGKSLEDNSVAFTFEDKEYSWPLNSQFREQLARMKGGDPLPIKCHPADFSKIIIDWEAFAETRS